MKTVALTGAAGYLGQIILQRLSLDNSVEKILAIDTKQVVTEEQTGKVFFSQADVRNPEVIELCKKHGVTNIIHLAFVVNPIRDVKTMHSINLDGTANILKAAAECNVNQIIVASSTSAFGAFPDNPPLLNEDDPVRKHSGYVYAADKYAVETEIKNFADKHPQMKVALVRPCIIYGPGVDNYLSRFILNWPFLLQVSSNRPKMQFVHEEDVTEVFIKVFAKEAEGVFHAIGEGLISTDEIANVAGIRVLALPPWLAYPLINLLYFIHFPGVEAPAAMLDFIRYSWTASDERTREMLDHKPQYSSKEVIQVLIESKSTRGDKINNLNKEEEND